MDVYPEIKWGHIAKWQHKKPFIIRLNKVTPVIDTKDMKEISNLSLINSLIKHLHFLCPRQQSEGRGLLGGPAKDYHGNSWPRRTGLARKCGRIVPVMGFSHVKKTYAAPVRNPSVQTGSIRDLATTTEHLLCWRNKVPFPSLATLFCSFYFILFF